MSISTRRQSVGIGDAFNINWDAVWEVKTNIGDYGGVQSSQSLLKL